MKKYRVWLNTGFAGVNNEDVIEIDDDATPEEIDEQCRDYAFNDIDWGYEEIEDELWRSSIETSYKKQSMKWG